MLLHRFAALTLFAVALTPVRGQTLLMQESFETPGGDYGYTLDPPNDCGCCETNDQWGRTTGTGAFTCAGVGGSAYPPGGISGTYYFGAEDTDDPDIQTPAGSLAPAAALILDTVRTDGLYLLELEVDLATPMSSTTAPSGFVPSGPFEADDAVLFQYAYNTDILAGNYTTFAALRANGDGDLAIDANGNGTIDGPALDSALTTFRFDIPGGGKFLSVRVLIDLDDAQEELALDRMGVYGCEPPTPPTGLLADTLICRGDTATIQLLGGSLGSWAEWRWYEGACGGPVAGSGTTLKVAPTVTTTYYVGPADGCVPIGACRAVTVQVREAAGSFTATTPTAACPPLLVSFEDQTPGAVAWQWSFPDGDPFPGVSTGSSPSFLYNVPGDYDVQLIVTDSFGCVDTVRETAFVDVREPNGSFTAITPTSGCVPLLVQFDDTTPDAVSWQWSFPDGDPFPGVSTGASPFFLYSRFGDFDVQLIVTDSYGCVDTVRQSDFVNAFGTDAAIGLSDTSGCNPLEVTFSDLSASYGGVTAWSWDFGDGTTSTLPAPVHTYTDGGVFDVTLDVTDANGCTSSASLNEAVLTDTVAPAVDFPLPAPVVALDAACAANLPDFTPDATVTDACAAGVVLTQSPVAGSVFSGVGTTVPVTITATDAGGNADSVSFTVTLEDQTAPALTSVPDQTVFADAACAASLPDYRGLTSATDACDPAPSLAQSPSPGTALGAAGATATVWLVATDASGNADSISFSVTVADSTRPTVAFPAGDQILVADAACAAGLPDYTGGAVAADNCTASPTVTQSPAAGTPLSGAGSAVSVWLTATDDAGNADSISFTVTLEDQTAPALTAVPDQTVFADAACAASLPDYRGLTSATDACDPAPSLAQSPSPGTALGAAGATATVWLVATDASGNADSISFSVTVADSTRPTVAFPAGDQILVADAACAAGLPDYTGGAVAADNCTASPTVTQSPAAGTPLSGAGSAVSVWLTATDDAGNADSISFTVTLEDQTAPVVGFPAGDQVAAADAACQAVLPDFRSGATVSDACDPAPLLTQLPAPGTVLSGAGTDTLVRIVATDAAGLSDTVSFLFTVIDVTAPSLTAVADQTLYADAACAALLPDFRGLSTVTDACDAAPVVTQSPAPGSPLSGTGSTVVTLTATDASGNPASVAFNAVLADSTAPSVAAVADQTVFADATCSATLPDYTALAAAVDNCDAAPVVTQVPVPGTPLSGTGPTAVTLTATDADGNAAIVSFNAVVADTIAPTVAFPAGDQVAAADAACQATLPDYTGSAVTADACDAAPVVTQSPAPGTVISGAGSSVNVVLTATDASGNADSTAFLFTLLDVTAPTLPAVADQTVWLDAACQGTMPDFRFLAPATDACDAAPVVTQSPAPGSPLSGVGTETVTLTATDASGNPASVAFTAILRDPLPPTLTIPADTALVVDAGCGFALPDFRPLAGAADNCDPAPTVVQTPAPGTMVDGTLGPVTVEIRVTDFGGYFTAGTFTVSPVDASAPSLICPASSDVLLSGVCAAPIPDLGTEVVVADNCDAAVVLTQSPVPGTMLTGAGASAVVTVTATDDAGNASSCPITVTLVDDEPPVIVCPADQTVPVDNGCKAELDDYLDAVLATDNCELSPVVQTPAAGTLLGGGHGSATTVTMSTMDAGGFPATCSFTVTLADTTSPNWTVAADTTLSVDTTCTALVPDFITAKPATDNCTASADLFFSQSPSAGTAIADTTWVTLITRDDAGNEASTQVRVNVDNALFPVFDACPDDLTVTTDAGQCGAAVDWTEPSAEGFCLTVATDRTHVPGETFDPGFHAVVYTATNAIGNTATCAFSVTVQDAEPPVVDCPGDTTILQDQLPFAYPVPGATDNCGLAGVELIDGIGGGIFPLGTTVEVWQAVDSAGNATTCSFAVTLERNPLPSGIGDPAAPAVTVYPNPAGDALYVRVDGAEGGAPRLLDALGRVQAIGVRPDGPGTPWTFDLRERPAGVYFVVVDGDGWRHAERVIAIK